MEFAAVRIEPTLLACQATQDAVLHKDSEGIPVLVGPLERSGGNTVTPPKKKKKD